MTTDEEMQEYLTDAIADDDEALIEHIGATRCDLENGERCTCGPTTEQIKVFLKGLEEEAVRRGLDIFENGDYEGANLLARLRSTIKIALIERRYMRKEQEEEPDEMVCGTPLQAEFERWQDLQIEFIERRGFGNYFEFLLNLIEGEVDDDGRSADELFSELDGVIRDAKKEYQRLDDALRSESPGTLCETHLLQLLGRWSELERKLVRRTQEGYYKFLIRRMK